MSFVVIVPASVFAMSKWCDVRPTRNYLQNRSSVMPAYLLSLLKQCRVFAIVVFLKIEFSILCFVDNAVRHEQEQVDVLFLIEAPADLEELQAMSDAGTRQGGKCPLEVCSFNSYS